MSSSLSSLATIILTGLSGLFHIGVDHTNPQFNLILNGQHDPQAIVQLEDLKPGDDRYVDKDLYLECQDYQKPASFYFVETSCNQDSHTSESYSICPPTTPCNDDPATIFLHLKDLQSSQGAQTEPEEEEENGQPKFDLENYILYDLKSADTDLITFDDHVLFPDAFSCWIPLGNLPPQTHFTIRQSFHFDPTVTNWAQGDTTTFTEEFLALSPDAPLPQTDSSRIWDPDTRTCQPGPSPTPSPSPTPTPTLPPIPEECQHIQFSGLPIVGTPGNDNLTGTPGNDLIFGLEGNDHLEGNSGDDCLVGGPGNDRLNGNHGSDVLLGGEGLDRLFGNNQDDYLNGGIGLDYANGGNGTDTCLAEVTFHCEL
jgi:hypothetical protein